VTRQGEQTIDGWSAASRWPQRTQRTKGDGAVSSHIEVKQTAAGVRYKAVVTIGSGRAPKRITRPNGTEAAAQLALEHLLLVAAGKAPGTTIPSAR
jgi:hypothetical protein